MSTFEVVLTPPHQRNVVKKIAAREPTDVFLALFSAKSIVLFEDIPIQKTARRILHIHNPSDDVLKVKVAKAMNTELNATLEWTSNEIPAQGFVSMDIVWVPLAAVSSRETLVFVDNRNFKKDVTIIFKSVDTSKKVSRKPSMQSDAIERKRILMKNASKPLVLRSKPQFRPNPMSSISHTSAASEVRPKRVLDTYKPINAIEKQNEFFLRHPISEMSNGQEDVIDHGLRRYEKENRNPTTPKNMSTMFDSIQFTPNIQPNFNTSNVDYLAAMPTPKSNSKPPKPNIAVPPQVLTNNTDRTFLMESETFLHNLSEVDQFALQQTPVSSNKPHSFTKPHQLTENLFEMKTPQCETPKMPSRLSREELNASRLFDASRRQSSPGYNLPQLSLIEEENSKIELSKTYIKPEESAEHHRTYNLSESIQNLAMNVSLVCTPLSKKYQSMRNLNDTVELSCEKKNLKDNQGSMPDLHKFEAVQSIESNRYFYQTEDLILQQQMCMQTDNNRNVNLGRKYPGETSMADTSICSIKSTVSTMSVAFQESEILAQSSCFNLNEIGKQQARKVVNTEKWARKTAGNNKLKVNEYISASSPTINKSRDFGKFSSSAQDIKSPLLSLKQREQKQIQQSERMLNLRSSAEKLGKGQDFRIDTWGGIKAKKLTDVINPDIFAATTTRDPFLAATMYLDEFEICKHEVQFKKWLNALVTIPGEEDESVNQAPDVTKLFNEVRNKDCKLAPTKESVSSKYLTKYRLNGLRAAAANLYQSEEMVPCLTKLIAQVEQKLIETRLDRNLHLDVVLQRSILELLLQFNPIWLRLGLEVVFNTPIHMNHNGDIVSLSAFILHNLFTDRSLEQLKHKRIYAQRDGYAEHIKKYTLKRILCLLFFLDKAKNRKIVKHNPCLFRKTSEFKETKDILLRFFSTPVLGNLGDIQRKLKCIGIVFTHKQTYIDEFDYAFRNLAIDLRDGVRLTKIMEIILLRDDLSSQLRVPAISRTQRIHNVGVALKALEQANFNLTGKITPADIADGHREKTLSLLWQIIYQFRAPKFHAAASVIQKWWRKKWLSVVIRRRIQNRILAKIEATRNQAACLIQATYRAYRMRQLLHKQEIAAVIIQCYVRRFLAYKQYKHTMNRIVLIQRWYRNQMLVRQQRKQFLQMKKCCCIIQNWYRSILLARKIEQKRISLIVFVQRRFRAQCLMKKDRQSYLTLKKATLCIETWYRACRSRDVQRTEYLLLQKSAIIIQTRIRSYFEMRKERANYLKKRHAALVIQNRFRATLAMKKQRSSYLRLCESVLKIQNRYRAKIESRKQRQHFLSIKKAVTTVQARYRAKLMARSVQREYKSLKAATICIQRRYRAKKAMTVVRTDYLTVRKSIVFIQRKFRANRVRAEYLLLLKYVCIVQRRFRLKQAARVQRTKFETIVKAVKTIQTRFRAYRQMKQQRHEYKTMISSAITIQRKFRATLIARQHTAAFSEYRAKVIFVQRKYRDILATRKAKADYLLKKMAVTTIQRSFRGYLKTKQARSDYLTLKSSVLVIQARYRALLKMRQVKLSYDQLKYHTIKMQRRFRSKKQTITDRAAYIELKNAAISVQRRFRANVLMKQERSEYLRAQSAAIVIQRKFRETKLMKETRDNYLLVRSRVICIQRWFRSSIDTRIQRSKYLMVKQSAIVIQRYVRQYQLMKAQRQSYIQQRSAAITIQRRFVAYKQMREVRAQFVKKMEAARKIQTFYRSYRVMKSHRKAYLRLKQGTLFLQRLFRIKLQKQKEHVAFLRLQEKVIVIQRRFRLKLATRKIAEDYQKLRSAVVLVQRKYRARMAMRVGRQSYLRLKSAAMLVQTRYRGKQYARQFQKVRASTIGLQSQIRGYLARKRFEAMMTPELIEKRRQIKAAIKIQAFWRGYRIRRTRSAALREISQKAKLLQQNVTENNTVRHRVDTIVRFLKMRFNVKDALNILKELEYISLTIPYALISDSLFIGNFCYGIMSQAIRSEVDKQLISLCCRVLLNLARYKPTQQSVFQIHHFETVAQILSRWCDKDCDIFNVLCTLLFVFIQTPAVNQQIRSFMVTREAMFLLREAKKLIARKDRMRAINPPAWMPVLTAREKRILPMLETNFGMGQSKNYIFNCAVFGFDTILSILNIII